MNELGADTIQPLTGISLMLYFYRYPVLVSWGGQDKLPQTEWLKGTSIHFLTVLEAGSLKLRGRQGHIVSPKALGDVLSLLFPVMVLCGLPPISACT